MKNVPKSFKKYVDDTYFPDKYTDNLMHELIQKGYLPSDFSLPITIADEYNPIKHAKIDAITLFNQHTNLILKAAIRYAAEEGMDGIGLITTTQQAERNRGALRGTRIKVAKMKNSTLELLEDPELEIKIEVDLTSSMFQESNIQLVSFGKKGEAPALINIPLSETFSTADMINFIKKDMKLERKYRILMFSDGQWHSAPQLTNITAQRVVEVAGELGRQGLNQLKERETNPYQVTKEDIIKATERATSHLDMIDGSDMTNYEELKQAVKQEFAELADELIQQIEEGNTFEQSYQIVKDKQDSRELLRLKRLEEINDIITQKIKDESVEADISGDEITIVTKEGAYQQYDKDFKQKLEKFAKKFGGSYEQVTIGTSRLPNAILQKRPRGTGLDWVWINSIDNKDLTLRYSSREEALAAAPQKGYSLIDDTGKVIKSEQRQESIHFFSLPSSLKESVLKKGFSVSDFQDPRPPLTEGQDIGIRNSMYNPAYIDVATDSIISALSSLPDALAMPLPQLWDRYESLFLQNKKDKNKFIEEAKSQGLSESIADELFSKLESYHNQQGGILLDMLLAPITLPKKIIEKISLGIDTHYNFLLLI